MKKLVMVSHESVFSGVVKCGMAEFVDSLANSLGQKYIVSLVCPDGNGLMARTTSDIHTVEDGVRACRFSCVDYYLVSPQLWPDKAADIVDMLQPDILHNLASPDLLSKLNVRPSKAIYTFDYADEVSGYEDMLLDYDSVTVNSRSYASGLMRMRNTLTDTLLTVDFRGITGGVLDALFDPSKGFLLPAKYTPDDQSGKQLCKQRLLQTYGLTGDPYICLMMCRLVEEKGIDDILAVTEKIKDSGGILLVVGKGDPVYEKQFKKFKRSDGVVYLDRWASPVQAAPLASGADFFLQPSVSESCGLMPMTASYYGAIPIVTLNGGLADNFNDDNAIIVDYDLGDAIDRAAALYADKDLLFQKRKTCMEQDFSWTTRKEEYISLYEE